MTTKDEILKSREKIVMDTLKGEFSFIYDHIVKNLRSKLEQDSQDKCADDLDALANDGLHHEQMDATHSSTNVSLDFEDTKNIMDEHQARLDLIAEIYND